MFINRRGIFFMGLIALLCLSAESGSAQQAARLHPINKRLIEMGVMPYPKYYPEIPRITTQQAYMLYVTGKALFTLISYQNKHLIVGGIHLTEDKPPSIDPNRLPFKPGQVLVAY